MSCVGKQGKSGGTMSPTSSSILHDSRTRFVPRPQKLPIGTFYLFVAWRDWLSHVLDIVESDH